MIKNSKTIKQNFIRENNVKVIIDLLAEKPYSCLEIANQTKMSDVGVNKIVKQLVSLNLVKRVIGDKNEKKIGGQHIRYTLNEHVGLYVCIDFTQLVDMAFVYDFAGNLVKNIKFNVQYSVTKQDIENAINILREELNSILDIYNNNILGIGISVPGQVDKNDNSFIESSKFKNFQNTELYDMFYKEFNTYIVIRNNVQMMAIGESYKGKLVNQHEIATYVYVGIGVAACVMFEGKNVSGWRGYAGEIGCSKVYKDVTLNDYCSLSRIIKKVRVNNPDITYYDLYNLYKTDESFKKIVNESAEALGMFLYSITNLIGCNLFMIDGMVLGFGDEYINIVREYLNDNSSIKVDVIKSSLENSAIVGAVKLLKDYVIINYYQKQLSFITENDN